MSQSLVKLSFITTPFPLCFPKLEYPLVEI
jgi:hypothetical protein